MGRTDYTQIPQHLLLLAQSFTIAESLANVPQRLPGKRHFCEQDLYLYLLPPRNSGNGFNSRPQSE